MKKFGAWIVAGLFALAEAQIERGQIEAAQKVAKATADYWARYVKGLKPVVTLPAKPN